MLVAILSHVLHWCCWWIGQNTSTIKLFYPDLRSTSQLKILYVNLSFSKQYCFHKIFDFFGIDVKDLILKRFSITMSHCTYLLLNVSGYKVFYE